MIFAEMNPLRIYSTIIHFILTGTALWLSSSLAQERLEAIC